jgi:hypothetical protein
MWVTIQHVVVVKIAKVTFASLTLQTAVILRDEIFNFKMLLLICTLPLKICSLMRICI